MGKHYLFGFTLLLILILPTHDTSIGILDEVVPKIILNVASEPKQFKTSCSDFQFNLEISNWLESWEYITQSGEYSLAAKFYKMAKGSAEIYCKQKSMMGCDCTVANFPEYYNHEGNSHWKRAGQWYLRMDGIFSNITCGCQEELEKLIDNPNNKEEKGRKRRKFLKGG